MFWRRQLQRLHHEDLVLARAFKLSHCQFMDMAMLTGSLSFAIEQVMDEGSLSVDRNFVLQGAVMLQHGDHMCTCTDHCQTCMQGIST